MLKKTQENNPLLKVKMYIKSVNFHFLCQVREAGEHRAERIETYAEQGAELATKKLAKK